MRTILKSTERVCRNREGWKGRDQARDGEKEFVEGRERQLFFNDVA